MIWLCLFFHNWSAWEHLGTPADVFAKQIRTCKRCNKAQKVLL